MAVGFDIMEKDSVNDTEIGEIEFVSLAVITTDAHNVGGLELLAVVAEVELTEVGGVSVTLDERRIFNNF